MQDGRRGFRVYVGGGTSTMTTAAPVLVDFMPAEDMLRVAEAIIRVFHERGDYQHRQRNRMKFLIKAMGWDGFRAAFEAALAQVRAEGVRELAVRRRAAGRRAGAGVGRGSRAAGRRDRSPASPAAAAQHGPGIHPEPPARGSAGGGLRALAAHQRPPAEAGGLRLRRSSPCRSATSAARSSASSASWPAPTATASVRVTAVQDLVFRWVRRADLPDLYARLEAAGLGLPDADTIADVTSCPGAESCKLAVTQSRGLGQALEQHLRATPALIDLAPDLDIKISGCPNGCGQHHIATIGFQGSLRKVDGRAVPQYFIQVGGGIDADGTTFGRLAAKVPARRAPEALERLVRLYAATRQRGESPVAFFRTLEVPKVKALLADLEALTRRVGQRHRLHRSRRDHRVPARARPRASAPCRRRAGVGSRLGAPAELKFRPTTEFPPAELTFRPTN